MSFDVEHIITSSRHCMLCKGSPAWGEINLGVFFSVGTLINRGNLPLIRVGLLPHVHGMVCMRSGAQNSIKFVSLHVSAYVCT